MADDKTRTEIAKDFIKLLGMFLFSGGFLIYAAPFLFSAEVDGETKKWLCTIVGMILGYWAK